MKFFLEYWYVVLAILALLAIAGYKIFCYFKIGRASCRERVSWYV